MRLKCLNREGFVCVHAILILLCMLKVHSEGSLQGEISTESNGAGFPQSEQYKGKHPFKLPKASKYINQS